MSERSRAGGEGAGSGLVLVVGAPSGTGKTTLLERLFERVPGLTFSVSHTTRGRRPGEVDGRDYHFVTACDFAAEIEAQGFLEWAEVYGHRYGTHRRELERAAAAGLDLVLDVDVQGARSVRRDVPGAVLVLVLPPAWPVLAARLAGRGTEPAEAIARRLGEARAQLEGFSLYDYAVVNDDVEEAAAALAAIVTAERSRLPRQRHRIDALLAAAARP